MKIFKESTTQQEKFKKAANKLLNKCFVVKKDEKSRNDYIFILEYKEEFEENTGVVGLSNYDGRGRLNLRKIESIFLLILRLLYIEKKKELSMHNEVVVHTGDIHEKYSMIKVEQKPYIDKTAFKESIRLFNRYNIISNIDTDISRSDCRIKIYPSVLFAVPVENINKLYDEINEKLDKYLNGGIADEEYDEDLDQD
jgi:hypothetical protein